MDHPVFRADPFSVQTPEPLLQFSIPSKLALMAQTLSEEESMVESQPSGRTSQGVDNSMSGLGLLGSQATQSQMATMVGRSNENHVRLSPESYHGSHGLQSSPSSQSRGSGRRGWPSKSPMRRNLGKSCGDVTSSPYLSRYRNRTSSDLAPPLAQAPSVNASFLDDDFSGKRSRAFSNLFKPKSAIRSFSKGGQKAK
jgi:hypothetical protein